jgi:hypothetical protein
MTPTRSQRQFVRERAGNCCEYCLLPATGIAPPFHIDHVIPVKHGGSDSSDNLCLACYKCNAHKGHDLGGFDPATGEFTRLFHPRQQSWDDHFELDDDMWIIGRTPEGRATVQLLQINIDDRLENRQILAEVGEFPCKKA